MKIHSIRLSIDPKYIHKTQKLAIALELKTNLNNLLNTKFIKLGTTNFFKTGYYDKWKLIVRVLTFDSFNKHPLFGHWITADGWQKVILTQCTMY